MTTRRVYVVTGAASGFGRSATLLLLQESSDACVLAVDWNLEGAEETCRLSGLGADRVRAFKADVSDAAASRAIIEAVIDAFGTLDGYFANAGVVGSAGARPDDITATDFERTLRVNTLGAFLAVRDAAAAFKRLNKTGASIVVTASVAGLRAGAGPVDYMASKAGAIAVVQGMAWELYGSGVRVNAIAPGLVETGMTRPLFEMARQRGSESKIGQLNPLRRPGTSEEVARVAMFLLSRDSSYINGQVIPVCGGLSSSHPVVPPKSKL